MQKVVGDDSNRGSEIQTPHLAPYGHPVGRTRLQDLLRQSPCLLSEEQGVPFSWPGLRIGFPGMATEREKPGTGGHLLGKSAETPVMTDVNLTPVIKAGPLQMPVIHPEAKRVNKVEPELRRPAEPRDITGV